MYRTRGTMLGVVAAVAAAGLLAGCGDEESTATSTPTLSTPAAASSESSAPAPAPGEQTPAPEAPAPPPEESAAPEAPPEEMERPAPVEPQEPAAAELGPKEQTYIDELAKQGVNPSTPDTALSIGSYVCSQVAQGTPDPAMLTWVTAMAGADAAFDPAKMPVEQAGQIYINTAKAHYC
ncbi:DUF732 domain-containing protein [Nocardia flavorosea]|uniref:DUF732 domain-containing protein n=1 Tax=Nocardia flavorosea TaxID=53429 RepID=A0A846YEE2_9NOCA|nr:DUF732 domain-containing protein [Nocardia flavorosea]NKY56221.1 DUF732 domain-containing protein [Nocardia flavorosea]